ncbi:Arylesterase [Ancylostoma duodenale]|uniref:Arylesterase n=1 Tax=Ancylostoma duodenale TaxID=51022 RepID=A0A0C2C2D3_9BILA|nr:Arylesterase [Ancylostoma duodenale]
MVLDVNKRVYNHRPGLCRRVEGIAHGAEDIALLEDDGIAFVTSGLFYMFPRAKGVQGRIFLYEFNQAGTYRAEPLKINGDYDQENFHPHGISHFVTSAGVRLFVINHSKSFEHSVMGFDWNRKSGQLDLVKVIKDDKFIRPNNLVAVSDDAFVLTNDGWAQTPITNFLEALSMIPSGSIVYYDGKESSWLMSTTTSPNGVAIDRDGKHLIISHANIETVSVYRIGEVAYRSLSHLVDVPLLTTMDNLYVDKEGAVWTVSPFLEQKISCWFQNVQG